MYDSHRLVTIDKRNSTTKVLHPRTYTRMNLKEGYDIFEPNENKNIFIQYLI